MSFNVADRALMMVFLIICMEELHCSAIQVDPPEEINIIDPGHLGHLDITWSLPASLINFQECLRYQVEYFNTYAQRWDVIQAPQRIYSAQFDLMKDIQIRVYTVLSGHCTNNSVIKSVNYTELVQKPPGAGRGDAVKHFECVFHNMERMICKWEKFPAKSQLFMYYWHNKLNKTEACPKYIYTNGVRSGCDFTGKPLPDFTDVNICVNGSSPEGPLRPKYTSLQIQNYVKPDPAQKPSLALVQDARINVDWTKPHGKVPGHCLEWEVKHTSEGTQYQSKTTHTMSTSLILPAVGVKNCFTVRSKLNKYCATTSMWSEWSHRACISSGNKSDSKF
ncbi:interleukin-13 receptor subunit alpha-2 isoform X2 [Festucalex cinctus]